jgi:hypothetical protein
MVIWIKVDNELLKELALEERAKGDEVGGGCEAYGF